MPRRNIRHPHLIHFIMGGLFKVVSDDLLRHVDDLGRPLGSAVFLKHLDEANLEALTPGTCQRQTHRWMFRSHRLSIFRTKCNPDAPFAGLLPRLAALASRLYFVTWFMVRPIHDVERE